MNGTSYRVFSLLALALVACLTGSPVAEASEAGEGVERKGEDDTAGDSESGSELEPGAGEVDGDEGSRSDLSCARGCVLEYHACMWSEWSSACDGVLDQCGMSCAG